MSNVCCKEFKGWVKSFTKVERALTVLEAILLVVLIILLILLILHLIVCSRPESLSQDASQNKSNIHDTDHRDNTDITAFDGHSTTGHIKPGPIGGSTRPGVKCSWTPSHKTTAAIRYYEDGRTRTANRQATTQQTYVPTRVPIAIPSNNTTQHIAKIYNNNGSTEMLQPDSTITTDNLEPETTNATMSPLEELEELIRDEQSDGEEAEDGYENLITALVKLKPHKEPIFGCILTIVNERWVMTAASCIEAIEETDSLDSFVIMENYGTDQKRAPSTVEDVQIHPLYEGKNKSYDLAVLQSSNKLLKGKGPAVEIASPLDYALLTLAQKFDTLGYGPFRSVGGGRQLRRAHVYLLPARRCARSGAALRHLTGGRALPQAPCGLTDLCAGVIFSRGLPCNYCAGAPLFLPATGSVRPRLLAILGESEQCGVSCEPARYVNMVEHADWLQDTVGGSSVD